MRLAPTLAVAAGFLLATGSFVLAQGVSSGLEVQVNPAAARAGGGTLLYPGGEYSRNVTPLLYPGERSGPIHLHMPSRHHVAQAAKPKKVASAAPDFFAPEPAPTPKPVPKRAAPKVVATPKAKPATAPSQVDASSPYFGAPNMSNVFGSPPAAPPPQKVAKANPPPASSLGNEGLTKRSVIVFAKDAADPAEGALGAIKFLAKDLNDAMTRPTSRVELQAFGGTAGDKGSDARRLSLKRALSIRQVLIDDGVSPDRIDVRAMGGSDDNGQPDRVDVYIKA